MDMRLREADDPFTATDSERREFEPAHDWSFHSISCSNYSYILDSESIESSRFQHNLKRCYDGN